MSEFFTWSEAPQAIRDRAADGWRITSLQGVWVDEAGIQSDDPERRRVTPDDVPTDEALALLEEWPHDDAFGVLIGLVREVR